MQEFTAWDNGHHMAGVERARWELWGSEAAKRRGAKLLPQLAESDLWVGPEELESFMAEVRGLLADVGGLRVELDRGSNCSLTHYSTTSCALRRTRVPEGICGGCPPDRSADSLDTALSSETLRGNAEGHFGTYFFLATRQIIEEDNTNKLSSVCLTGKQKQATYPGYTDLARGWLLGSPPC